MLILNVSKQNYFVSLCREILLPDVTGYSKKLFIFQTNKFVL